MLMLFLHLLGQLCLNFLLTSAILLCLFLSLSLHCLSCHRSTQNYFSWAGPTYDGAAVQSRRLRVRRRWQSHALLQMGAEVSE